MNQQHQQQHQSTYNQGGNNHYSSGPGLDGYYGFTGPNTQQHQQNQAYFAQSSNGFGHGNGSNGNGLNHGYNPPQPQYMNPNYDPFELGVATGTGMFFNPSLQYMQQQQYFSNLQPQPHQQQQQQQQSNATTNYLHRPTLETTNTISPNGSNPGSAQSSHLNLHSITPERTSAHTNTPPDREPTGSPVHDVITGPTRPLGRNREGPVKAACLSCRQKKAKCDGVKPICTQASLVHIFQNNLTPCSATRKVSSVCMSSRNEVERGRSVKVSHSFCTCRIMLISPQPSRHRHYRNSSRSWMGCCRCTTLR